MTRPSRAPPPLLLRPTKIVRFDVERERVVRDAAGRCVEAAAGEVGELLGLIDNADVTRRFDGYTDRAATEKKILRDVAAEGDLYFSTGDLVRQDAEGFVYFVDRIGDTFRWKGENVSTAEVRAPEANHRSERSHRVCITTLAPSAQRGDTERRSGRERVDSLRRLCRLARGPRRHGGARRRGRELQI